MTLFWYALSLHCCEEGHHLRSEPQSPVPSSWCISAVHPNVPEKENESQTDTERIKICVVELVSAAPERLWLFRNAV